MESCKLSNRFILFCLRLSLEDGSGCHEQGLSVSSVTCEWFCKPNRLLISLYWNHKLRPLINNLYRLEKIRWKDQKHLPYMKSGFRNSCFCCFHLKVKYVEKPIQPIKSLQHKVWLHQSITPSQKSWWDGAIVGNKTVSLFVSVWIFEPFNYKLPTVII